MQNHINWNQPNVLGVLNAMVASDVTFLDLSLSAGGIDIVECLHMIGFIPRFGPFLNPCHISDGSDQGVVTMATMEMTRKAGNKKAEAKRGAATRRGATTRWRRRRRKAL